MSQNSMKTVWVVTLGLLLLSSGIAPATEWNFEDARIGNLPTGWVVPKTESTLCSGWRVEFDDTAPRGGKALVQTSSDCESPVFNLCVAEKPKLADVDLSVSLKAISGEIDQGGGGLWRYQDAKNYYVARVNPLESNFRLFKVVAGQRTRLATADIAVGAGAWHLMRVMQRADRIECYLNGRKLLEAVDQTFEKPGQIGLWTKADAVTAFDGLSVVIPSVNEVAKDSNRPGSPDQVLVVNTGDSSVSVVDLTSMKETSRHTVGAKPYGIAVLSDGKSVAVGVEDESCVKFFSLPSFEFQSRVAVGPMHNDHIILSRNGREIYVANYHSDDVLVIDAETHKETTRISGCSAPHVVKYGPLRQRAFVTCKKVTGIAIIDPENKTLLKFHQLNVNPRSLTFSPDESKVYFGSFWVNGFFEMETETGRVTRLIAFDPPADNKADQEVTYHGVEAVGHNIVLAANEGRSYVDAVDVSKGQLLDRMAASKPCCIERIPGSADGPNRVLVSNLGDDTLELVQFTREGKLKSLAKAQVGAGPKRVAFLPIVVP